MSGFWRKVVFLIRRGSFDRELAEEMRHHVEMKAEKLTEGGVPHDEARYRAQREFGNAVLLKDSSRDFWQWRPVEELAQDLRFGLRMLRRSPGFTCVAVATLALGIAANTTIFSVVSAILLKAPPVTDPDRVMIVLRTGPRDFDPVSAPDFIDWRDQSKVFEEMAAADVYHDFSLTGQREPERLTGMQVSSNYFHVLGVSAMLGRTFLPGEDQPGHDPVVVLGHGLWQRRFASDPGVIGKTVGLDGQKFMIAGVMPAAFRLVAFPNEMWTPLVFSPRDLSPAVRQSHFVHIFARLKSGVAVEKARAEMMTIGRRIDQTYAAPSKSRSATVISLQQYMIQDAHVTAAMILLMSAVGFVLLIACANVASLLLARAAARRQEIAIRISIGAGRLRLVRQLLAESMLIAAIGGSVGLMLAYWGVDLLRTGLHFNDYGSAMAAETVLDARVLAFTAGVSVLAALLFGLAPALQASASNLQATLKQGGRTGAGELGTGKMRGVLVAGEIATALMLLSGAGLMIEGLREEMSASLGFDPEHVLTAEISLRGSRYEDPRQRAAFFRAVIQRLENVPGVLAVAGTTNLPLNAGKRTFTIEGQPVSQAERQRARSFTVSPDYLRVMRIPLMRGRALRESDTATTPGVALVNEAFVRRFFPKQDPIGQRIGIDDDFGQPAWREIVGVTGDVSGYFGQTGDDPQFYEVYLQRPTPEIKLAVRTAANPSSLAAALRNAVWAVDKDQPITGLMPMTRVVSDSGAGDRFLGILLGIFAGMALVLSVVGVYGVTAYAAMQRTHEIGIRMALGARKSDVLRLVVGKGMLLTLVGTAIGLAGALPLPRLLAAAFQDFSAQASAVFIGVPVLVGVSALVASYIPARRAAKVDPMVALRYE
jgi:predicted permease